MRRYEDFKKSSGDEEEVEIEYANNENTDTEHANIPWIWITESSATRNIDTLRERWKLRTIPGMLIIKTTDIGGGGYWERRNGIAPS